VRAFGQTLGTRSRRGGFRWVRWTGDSSSGPGFVAGAVYPVRKRRQDRGKKETTKSGRWFRFNHSQDGGQRLAGYLTGDFEAERGRPQHLRPPFLPIGTEHLCPKKPTNTIANDAAGVRRRDK